MPLYEYACRACGGRIERMRKVEERLAGPECPACGQPTVLTLSAPARVGGSATGGSVAPFGGGHACATGGCCGGGSCSPGLN